jgi:hypothetical protein
MTDDTPLSNADRLRMIAAWHPEHAHDLEEAAQALDRTEDVVRAFRNADDKDWERLHQILGYSAHGKFWRAVLIDEAKPALLRLKDTHDAG